MVFIDLLNSCCTCICICSHPEEVDLLLQILQLAPARGFNSTGNCLLVQRCWSWSQSLSLHFVFFSFYKQGKYSKGAEAGPNLSFTTNIYKTMFLSLSFSIYFFLMLHSRQLVSKGFWSWSHLSNSNTISTLWSPSIGPSDPCIRPFPRKINAQVEYTFDPKSSTQTSAIDFQAGVP